MAAEWCNRYVVSIGLISIYLKSNNTVLGHCIAQICLIFQIKDNSWNAGLFLAYLQCFDVIPQPSGSWHTMKQVPDPTSGLYALKWAMHAENSCLRDIVPLTQIWAAAQISPHLDARLNPVSLHRHASNIAQTFGLTSMRVRKCFGLYILPSLM